MDTSTRVGRYLLSTAVITAPGTYQYEHATPEQARAWLNQPYVSALGYDVTADALATLLDIARPDVERRAVKMHVGDEALVFRLKLRVSDPRMKMYAFTPQWVMDNSEIGILTRVA